MKKLLGILMTMILPFGAFLVGCSGSDEASNDEEGKVTLTLWNRINGAESYLTEVIDSFEKEHPNIKIDLQNLSVESAAPQYQAAISSNELPDMFVRPPETGVKEMVEIDRLQDLEEIFPQEVRDQFVDGVFAPGTSMMAEGKLYGFPLSSAMHGTTMLYYNKDVLENLGIEFDLPLTWDEFMEVGKEVNEKSDGSIYGMILGLESTWLNSSFIAQMAYPISPDTGVDHRTGMFNLATEGNIETINYFKDLFINDVISPVSLESTSAEAQSLFAAGQAAFLINGNWVGGIMTNDFDFENYGVTNLPVKEEGTLPKRQYTGGSTEFICVAKNTKHFEEVKTFLNFMLDHLYEPLFKSGTLAAAKVPENADLGFPQNAEIQEIMNELNILVPNALAVNPTIEEVDLKYNELAPRTATGDILLGYLAGQVTNLEAELQKLTDESNEARKKAIEAFDNVTIDDYSFPNWDPTKSYTDEDYTEINKN